MVEFCRNPSVWCRAAGLATFKRHRSRLVTLIVVALSVFIGSCGSSLAAAELSKADAIKLLGFMNYKNVVVATVVNGSGGMGIAALSSPNVAMVIAYGELNGEPHNINQTFFYDKELGWIFVEVDTNGRSVRLWTTTGYKELKPPAPNK